MFTEPEADAECLEGPHFRGKRIALDPVRRDRGSDKTTDFVARLEHGDR